MIKEGTFNEIIRAHYLPAFLYSLFAVSVPFLPLFFDDEKKGSKVVLFYVMIGLILTITLILGFLKHKFLDDYNERRKQKVLHKKTFQDFIADGFVKDENFVSGYIDGYFVMISPESDTFTPEKWLNIEILFNPKQHQQFISQKVFHQLINDKALKKKEYTWYSNSLVIKKQYGFKLPSYVKLMAIVTEAIDVLKSNQLEAIVLNDWNALQEEVQNHYKQISSLNR